MSRKTTPPYVHAIRLEDAVLCADCEMISESRHDHCTACGGRALMSLARVVEGRLDPQRTRLLEMNQHIARSLLRFAEQ